MNVDVKSIHEAQNLMVLGGSCEAPKFDTRGVARVLYRRFLITQRGSTGTSTSRTVIDRDRARL